MSNICHLTCFASGIRAAYTTRHGGFSQSPYASFNLALHVGDKSEAVVKNRDKLKELMKLESICYMDQVHGSDVVYVKDESIVYKADALVTDRKNLGIAVMTADCLPLLLAADNAACIAAVHCGWRSSCAGIIGKTVDRLKDLGAASISAFIGPCILHKSFEVGSEVKEAFEQVHKDNAKFFTVNDRGRYMCDLVAICAGELNRLGIDNIHRANLDTLSCVDDFFSYRKEGTTGRMASVIALS